MAQPTSCQALGQRHRSGHTDYTKRPFSCGSLPYVPSLRAKSIRTRASATLPLLTEHTEHDGQGTEHASGRGSWLSISELAIENGLGKAAVSERVEPFRVSRRPFGLGQAAKACTLACTLVWA